MIFLSFMYWEVLFLVPWKGGSGGVSTKSLYIQSSIKANFVHLFCAPFKGGVDIFVPP